MSKSYMILVKSLDSLTTIWVLRIVGKFFRFISHCHFLSRFRTHRNDSHRTWPRMAITCLTFFASFYFVLSLDQTLLKLLQVLHFEHRLTMVRSWSVHILKERSVIICKHWRLIWVDPAFRSLESYVFSSTRRLKDLVHWRSWWPYFWGCLFSNHSIFNEVHLINITFW